MKSLYTIYLFSMTLFISTVSNSCEKTIYTFDNTDPQIISDPKVLFVTDSTATIFWVTDETCNSKIKYGKTTDYDSVYIEEENRENHTVTLVDLIPYMQYHYKVYNWDFADNGPVKSEDLTFTTLHNEYSLLREGWVQFAEGDYDSAQSLIYKSLSINPYLPDTYAAVGWTQMRLDSIDATEESFQKAYSLNPYLLITLAGFAVINQFGEEPLNAINYANEVLNKDPEWVFEYNPSINYKTMHLILAECYYQTQQLEQAKNEIDFLWPENGLDPNIPATWVINGTVYNSYAAALIAAINYAADNIGLGKKVNLELDSIRCLEGAVEVVE